MMRRTIGGIAAIGAAASTVLLVRRLACRSGATDAEVEERLPGDELLPEPMIESTRAITIRAPAARVWPWVVQMGYHRGGWYTNARLDKLIWRINNPSADRVVPELQQVAVGDVIPDGPEGTARFVVARIEPGRVLALHDPDGTHIPNVDFSWTFVVRAVNPITSRLIVRMRAAYPRTLWAGLVANLLAGPADFVMAHMMLLRGIKERAERAERRRTLPVAGVAHLAPAKELALTPS